MPEIAFIFIGSNIEPEVLIPRAMKRVSSLGKVIEMSNVFTDPFASSGTILTYDIGEEGSPFFMQNVAVLLETKLPLAELHMLLASIEASLGRVRGKRDDMCDICIELCLYGNVSLTSNESTKSAADNFTDYYLAATIAGMKLEVIHQYVTDSLRHMAKLLIKEMEDA